MTIVRIEDHDVKPIDSFNIEFFSIDELFTFIHETSKFQQQTLEISSIGNNKLNRIWRIILSTPKEFADFCSQKGYCALCNSKNRITPHNKNYGGVVCSRCGSLIRDEKKITLKDVFNDGSRKIHRTKHF